MDKYLYFIILIIFLNYLLFKVYFINFNFCNIEKKKLKKDFKKARDVYIEEYPKLVSNLGSLTVDLNKQLEILENN